MIETIDVHGKKINVTVGDTIRYAQKIKENGDLIGHLIVTALVTKIDRRRFESIYVEGDGFGWWVNPNHQEYAPNGKIIKVN